MLIYARNKTGGMNKCSPVEMRKNLDVERLNKGNNND